MAIELAKLRRILCVIFILPSALIARQEQFIDSCRSIIVRLCTSKKEYPFTCPILGNSACTEVSPVWLQKFTKRAALFYFCMTSKFVATTLSLALHFSAICSMFFSSLLPFRVKLYFCICDHFTGNCQESLSDIPRFSNIGQVAAFRSVKQNFLWNASIYGLFIPLDVLLKAYQAFLASRSLSTYSCCLPK